MFRIIFILAIILQACSSQTDKSALPAVPVTTANVVVKNVPLNLEVVGTLKPSKFAEVKPQLSGTLAEAVCREGQLVKKGDPLFKIDSTSSELKYKEVHSQYVQNKTSLELAEKKLERYKTLSQKDLISQQEWDDLQSQVALLSARIEGDEAKLTSAKLTLEDCVVRAPIDGRVGKLYIHPGNQVSTNNLLTTISKLDPLTVEFKLSEKDFNQLPFDHATGSFPINVCGHCQSTSTDGCVTFLDHSFEERTGLIFLMGTLPNSKQRFLPGQIVKICLPIATIEDAKLVPSKAVKINQNGPYVFVVKDDQTIAQRQLILGEEIGDKMVVREGLDGGESVVIDGHLRLYPGIKVEIKNEG